MKKASTLLVSLLLPALVSALGALSCAGGQTAGPTGTGAATGSSGGSTGTGGRASTGSGGSTFGTGGSTGSGTGGSTGPGSGGSTFGTGGAAFSTGGSTFGTGGTTSGTGGSTAAGSGGSMMAGGIDNVSAMSGYINNSTWKGYAFTATFGTGVTIAPVCDAAGTAPCFKAAAKQVCASGSVPAMDSAGAQLGWNINQAVLPPNPKMTVATGSTGLSVTLSGDTTGLRIQIQSGDTLRWCAPVTAASQMIPWTMFNTTCWTTGGTPFTAATMIDAVSIVVPGAAGMVKPFNFCLVDAHQY